MRVIVGRVGRPHGIRGEVVIAVRTDEPDQRFAVGAILDADREPPGEDRRQQLDADRDPPEKNRKEEDRDGEDRRQQLTVAATRWHSGQLLVAFAGVTDRTAAGELTGSWLSLDSGQLPPPPDPDEFRDHELIGLSVRTCGGDPVGVVTDVLHYGQDLLVVRDAGLPGGECLVPFVKAIVPEVDVAGGVLVIDPPAGLLDPSQAE